MCKICDWIRSKFCDSKTAYEEMEEYKAKYQNPSSRTTADKGVKIFLSSYHNWRTEMEMAHPSKTGLKLGENLYGEILIIFSVNRSFGSRNGRMIVESLISLLAFTQKVSTRAVAPGG